MHQHKPTKDEVLEAVEKSSVYVDVKGIFSEPGTRKHQPRTAADVAEFIYTAHHGSIVQRQYESRTSVLRRGVAVSTVKKHLETLAEEGAIFAVSGDHWSARGTSGLSARSTVYLGSEAATIALEKEQRLAATRREKAAQEAAEKIVLGRHTDEVKAEWERILEKATAKAKQPAFGDVQVVGQPVAYRVQGGEVEEI